MHVPTPESSPACDLVSRNPFRSAVLVRSRHVALTEQASKQCGQWIGVRNQIEFGTQICNALDEFQVHDVTSEELCRLSRDHDIIFPWSLQYVQWNDEAVGQQALDWVDGLTKTLDGVVSDTAWFGIPDLQLGSQLTDPPNLDYVNAYWSSLPKYDFVPFLIEVKNRYDCDDLFRFAQSIPLSMDDDDIP